MNRTVPQSMFAMFCALIALLISLAPQQAHAIATPPTTNLTEWFRADAVVGVANGGGVTTWVDQAAGNGSQSANAAGTTPTFVLNSANGLPALDFAGTGGRYVTTSTPGITGTGGSVYVMVVAVDSFTGGLVTNGNGTHLMDRDAASNQLMTIKAHGTKFGLQKRDDAGAGLGGPISTTDIATSGAYQIVTARRNVSSNLFELYVNGVLQGTTADPGTALTPLAPVIGGHQDGSAAKSLNGRIAEVLIYNDDLSTTDLQGVHSYLNTKYFGKPYVAIPGLFNTGVDNSGTPLANNAASLDTHYVLTANPDGTGPSPRVQDETVFPIVGPWVDNTATSKWISPRFDSAASASGNYDFTLTFNLSGLEAGTAYISGQWATDNEGIALLINGVPTGLVNTTQFGSFTNFLITEGFVSGLNTLTFRVNNSAVGYAGLHVTNLQGFAQIAIPEPASAILGVFGLGALAMRRRRAA